MKRVGWAVISPQHGLGLFLEEEAAMAQAVKLHGVTKDLVLGDDVLALCQSQFDAGVRHGLLLAKAESEPKG